MELQDLQIMVELLIDKSIFNSKNIFLNLLIKVQVNVETIRVFIFNQQDQFHKRYLCSY